MLGLGRAMGETIAVALVIGAADPDHAEPVRQRRRAAVDHRAQLGRVQRHLPGRAGRLRGRAVRDHRRDQLPGARIVVRRAEIRLKGATRMTTVSPHRTARAVPADLRSRRDLRPGAGSPTSRREGRDHRLALVVAVVPLGLVTYYVISKGLPRSSAGSFLTERIPRQPTTVGGGIGPAIIGTLIITGVAAAHRDSARRARRDLPQRVRQAEPAGPHHPHHGRRHDRRPVDRHGPVHLPRRSCW